MSWFESWFDSPYYHILYQHRDDIEAESFLDNLIAFLNPPAKARMLDLGCGKGRHSLYLNEKGYEVTGLDLSEKSINYCRQFENNTLSFFVHDMRKLFRVNDFDYVFNLFTSFGYFEKDEDNYHAISNACLSLKKEGTLVIDFMNTDYVEKNLVKREDITLEDIDFKIERKFENGFFTKEINFTDENKDYQFIEKVSGLKLKDFENFLGVCGMKITTLFGDYKLTAFNNSVSPRLIIIAVKHH